MRNKNIKISTQLVIGFSIVLVFVVVLGLVTYLQTYQLFQHTETLYKHPLQVRETVDEIEIDVLTTRVGVRDLVLSEDEDKRQENIQAIELSLADIQKQFEALYELYLGPATDIDNAYEAFIKWRTATEDRIDMAQAGEIDSVVESLGDQGDVGIYRDQLMSGIEVIDNFASNKADELYADYVTQFRSLNLQRFTLIAVILFISILISIILIRTIREPLNELNNDITRFHQGDLNARCRYKKNNEFGTLSTSFNAMADTIQMEMELNEKTADLAGVMLSQEDAKEFFKSTLGALAEYTGAQIAAVYLLGEDKKHFVHFESIGLDGKARDSFDAKNLEGEFGLAVSSRKRQYIKLVPEETRFVLLTSGGQFVPQEIITIPILAGKEVISVITLASVSKFKSHAIELIDKIIVTMSARIEGILAFQTIKEFITILEQQNQELDAQKSELTAQAAELTQQNAELDIQKNQLAEASRLKTSFLSNMSHELRTPLNSIIALSGVLDRRLAKQIPEEEHSYLEVIERNGKNLLELINDILDISRIESGREEIEITRFGINNILADIVALLDPQAKQKGIELIRKLNESNISITSDDKKCRHIFQNIIGNAVKFTETGEVKVSVREDNDRIEVKVTDTGIGIAEKDLPHIFDEFRQADSTTSRRFGGTGLGLAIAKKYANLLGGNISVTSTVGKGSEFTVSLPLSYNNETGSAEMESTEGNLIGPYLRNQINPDSILDGKTILLIEDSEPAIIQIKDLMEKSGHRILIAHNAGEAFKLINEIVPDAIILDLMMPDIDGFETLNTLRSAEKAANIPVLILTAKHITKDELRLLKQNHIYQIIQKGDINRIDLLNTIANMLYPELIETNNLSHEQRDIKDKPVVLVVEDNPDNMTTVKALLEDKYQVIEAKDGEEGIEWAKTHMPDLVLMDIALPGISGVEAFQAIRNAPATQHIPIIALTASAIIQERESILSHGFDAFIAKPIIIDELFKAIGEVLYGQ